jgi:heterodisulfide reductase subunit B
MSDTFAFFRGCMIPTKQPHIEYVARLVLPRLGAQLVDIAGFTCCPDPVGVGAADPFTWITIAARNVSLAEERNLDVLTLCNGCAYTLRHAVHDLTESPELCQRVNDVLVGTGHVYQGTSQVKHFLPWLARDVGFEAIRRAVKRPLTGLRVATHTGCHLLSPQYLHGFDDSEVPVVFDQLVEALGATAVDYETKPACCGIGFAVTGQLDPSGKALAAKLTDVHNNADADCITVGCPFCYQQFDMGQLVAARKFGLDFQVPVLNYLQLLGLALGFDAEEMQLHAHKVKAKGTSLGEWLNLSSEPRPRGGPRTGL